ncbi:hypothetical protein GN958_ATG05313 [Phytophthora infestans]|uniref:Uncharacterized protein n=1 Tax=Phytophthora infestans TaxID=4787 RepID=A0A8S9UXV9_PHYIN|nr:hypothetical protein GN958_ATG05313 [Phytophthora infestans]
MRAAPHASGVCCWGAARGGGAYVFRDYFLDAAVLQVLEAQTEDNPFRLFDTKWMAFASPSGPARVFSPRGHADYEYAKTVTTDEGYKVLVKVIQSMETTSCPGDTDCGP